MEDWDISLDHDMAQLVRRASAFYGDDIYLVEEDGRTLNFREFEAEALIDEYGLASPTQAADPGARESLTEAITAIAECAARDPRCAETLELLRVGKHTEAEHPLNAVAEGEARLPIIPRSGPSPTHRRLRPGIRT